MAEVERLLAELDASRGAFHEALADVDTELVMVPGVIGDWSVRDLVVHVAAWCEHGAEALDLAAAGSGAEFAYSRDDTDAMNARFQADAARITAAAALAREEEAFGGFRERIGALDPSLLDERLGNGDSVEAVIRYDGPAHYAEHTEHLRAWFASDTDDAEDGMV